MTHKVHPKIFRIKEITDWDSRGFYKNPAECLEEDFNIRKFLWGKLARASVEKIEIERFPGKLNIIIHSARPGLIIGRSGEGVEQLKKTLEEKILKKNLSPVYEKNPSKNLRKEGNKTRAFGARNISLSKKENLKEKKEIRIEIREIKNPWTSASLVAQWVAQQIEKRVNYRRVLKQALSKISVNKEIQGARIELSGRLNGTEIARTQWLKIGRLPLQTIRSKIDYAKHEAYCTYGVIGIKIWLYKGEKFD